EKHPFAEEVLHFYKGVAILQKSLYSSFEKVFGEADTSCNLLLDPNLNLDTLLPEFGEFLSRVQSVAPGPLRTSASDLRSRGSRRWRELLTSTWRSSRDFQPSAGDGEVLLASMFLQPLAEFVADHSATPPRSETLAICPLCNGRPLVGVLRPEGDGA